LLIFKNPPKVSLKPVPNVTQSNPIYLKAFHQPMGNLCSFDKGILVDIAILLTDTLKS
jgi:hypothetical protein